MKRLGFAYGCTRFVILYGDRAYKFPRIGFIRPFIRLIEHWKNGEVRSRLARFDERPFHAVLYYLLAGFHANREEWYISQRYPKRYVAKVYALYCGGVLLIQERGREVRAPGAAMQHPLWEMMFRSKQGNVAAALAQFAVFDGGVVKLIDLGRGDLDAMMFS